MFNDLTTFCYLKNPLGNDIRRAAFARLARMQLRTDQPELGNFFHPGAARLQAGDGQAAAFSGPDVGRLARSLPLLQLSKSLL